MDKYRIRDFFHGFAGRVSDAVGSPWAFVAAMSIVGGWALSGPFFNFSDTWQLVINTGTTIVTFLMVFVIQHTQNRDACAMQLKLDELIFSVRKARNDLIDLEDAPDDEIKRLRDEFKHLRAEHHRLHGITLAPEAPGEPPPRADAQKVKRSSRPGPG